MKLNLGCGGKYFDGYINVDTADVAKDASYDIRKLPYADESVDEIVAIHVFEHFLYTEAESILREWHRVLHHGGRLILELPCLDKILRLFAENANEQLTLWGLYGEPATHPHGMEHLHKWCWSKEALSELLRDVGFGTVLVGVPKYHVPPRDMRLECLK